MADVASSFKNWSASPASNNPTSATVIGSGLAPNLQQIQATLRTELGARSATITAASTVDLNAVDEGTVEVEHISGTVNLSSFGNVQSGIKKLVTFSVTSGSLTLVFNATSMIIPSAANIVVNDGDSLQAESLGGGNWKVHSYSRADGKAVKGETTTAASDPTFSANNTSSVSSDWVKGALHASGSAPMYACRAWVNFKGTGTVTIRGSGNVTSITDNGTGLYTINFSVAMPHANYCANVTWTQINSGGSNYGGGLADDTTAYTVNSVSVRFQTAGGNAADMPTVAVSVFC